MWLEMTFAQICVFEMKLDSALIGHPAPCFVIFGGLIARTGQWIWQSSTWNWARRLPKVVLKLKDSGLFCPVWQDPGQVLANENSPLPYLIGWHANRFRSDLRD
jgi:hypothetical protein